MLRTLFVCLVVASLALRAGTAYACDMMGGAVEQHCCCGGEAAGPKPDDAPCCQPIVVVGEDGAATSDAALPSKPSHTDIPPNLAPAPMTAVSGLLGPPVPQGRTVQSRPISRSGTLTYLDTRRLRI